MKYRPLGNTGLEISEIGFGCGPNAGLMISGSLEERKTIVARALELGVNYFDTAAVYGDGLSETNLGEVLKSLRARPIIGSKVVLQTDDLGDIRKAVIDSVEESLKRLQVDCIDLIQLHNRVKIHRESLQENFGVGPLLSIDEVIGSEGVVEAFERLRQQGKVRFFGFTTFGGEVPAIYQLIDSNRFHTINTEYNLLNPSADVEVPVSFEKPNYGQVIPRAAKNNMGVLVIRVLAGGAINGKEAESLSFLRNVGQSLPQAATKFALINSDVSTIIGGFSNMSHLEEAVACSGSDHLDEKTLGLIKRLH